MRSCTKSRAGISNELNINNTPLLSIYNLGGPRTKTYASRKVFIAVACIGISAMATAWCQAIDKIL